jgi:peptidoglycan/LPS O-acetylase OafA/YrhL
MGLIGQAAQGFKGVIGNILELRLIVYLGRISYGVYVYHLLVPYIINKASAYFGLTYPNQIEINFALYTLGMLVFAVFSWHFFEKPINHLKQYFGYKKEGLSTH